MMAIFGAIAIVLAMIHLIMSKVLAMLYVCRSGIGNGAAFAQTVLLVFYPVSAHVRDVLSVNQVAISLSAGAATIAFLQVVALLRGP